MKTYLKENGMRLLSAALIAFAAIVGIIEPAAAMTAGVLLMAAHTGVAGFSDTTYAITASLPATYDGTGYTGTTGFVWTSFGDDVVESFPEYGEQRGETEFNPVSGAVAVVKGASNYGGGLMTMADIPANAAQVIAKAACSGENRVSMKVTLPDGEIHYLDVHISSWRLVQQQAGALMKRTANIRVMRAPVIVAAV